MNNISLFNVNLTKDIDLRKSASGNTVVKFSVAENSYENGQQVTQYWNCVCFGSLAEFAAKYLKKGSSVNIIGELKQNKYTNKEGNKECFLEITCDRINFANSGKVERKVEPVPQVPKSDNLIEVLDDYEIPFDV